MLAYALMVVRDEEAILPFNLKYHLDLGFDHIFVLDNHSVDKTAQVLDEFALSERITVIRGSVTQFDHERLANELLQIALACSAPDWIFLLDADEFLDTRQPLKAFLEQLEHDGISYGTLKWLNAISQSQQSHLLGTTLFFEPWPEREWQHEGHLRKAFCRVHKNMQIVVGGHYFRSESNPEFFRHQNPCPILIGIEEARIYHYENRFGPSALLRKWENLSSNTVESGYSSDAPWNEKITRIRQYLKEYRHNQDKLWADWFVRRRTFWGEEVPLDRIRQATCIKEWFEAHGNERNFRP